MLSRRSPPTLTQSAQCMFLTATYILRYGHCCCKNIPTTRGGHTLFLQQLNQRRNYSTYLGRVYRNFDLPSQQILAVVYALSVRELPWSRSPLAGGPNGSGRSWRPLSPIEAGFYTVPGVGCGEGHNVPSTFHDKQQRTYSRYTWL